MKDKLVKMIEASHKYNSEHMAFQSLGLSEDTVYDAIVIAPSFSPYKLHMDEYCEVTTLKEGSYVAGYSVKKDGLNIAWVKTASSAGNIIDYMTLCAELSFKRLIFTGAVGALKEGFDVGDICTPAYSVAGSMADLYLQNESFKEGKPFAKVVPDMAYVDQIIGLGREKGYDIRKASVFCTPSLTLEYIHLDEIRSFDTDLIEMETSAFYYMTDLFELPGIALLVVSDNSASGVPLVGRSEDEERKYDYGRHVVIPDMILSMAAL